MAFIALFPATLISKGSVSPVLLNTLAWLGKVLGGDNTPTNAIHTNTAACSVRVLWHLACYCSTKGQKAQQGVLVNKVGA